MYALARLFQPILVFAVLLGAVACANAETITVDFEGLSDSTFVTTQFPGLVFTNATAVSAGISLNEFEFPPRSGSNAVIDDGGPLSIVFASPVQSFGGYFTYSSSLTLSAFDATNNLVASTASLFSSNLALSGAPGSSPNELLVLSVTTGISRITVSGDPLGGSFALDDVRVTTIIPEPASLTLLLTGSLALIRFRKRITASRG